MVTLPATLRSLPRLEQSLGGTPGMDLPQDGFWKRVGLQETDRTRCLEAIRGMYDGYHVDEFEYQGYCSFTLLLSPLQEESRSSDGFQSNNHMPITRIEKQLIVQFRPAQHALDLGVTWATTRVYSPLVPSVRSLDVCLFGGLHVYEMNKLEGIPLSRLRIHTLSTGVDLQAKQETLVANFAKVVAQSWKGMASKERRDSVMRIDSPSDEEQTLLSLCTGKVGSRIIHKLKTLVVELPDQTLRDKAQTTLQRLREIDDYPIVLNHGDLIPSNILVNEETWEILGLVDWAEAEWLPFGTCLYGLEHLLGFLQLPLPGLDRPTFVYCENAQCLRTQFWSTLFRLLPELESRQEEVHLMRDVGVFLWHGYAWDAGAIDRVVDEVNDGEELAKLRAFLNV